MITVLSVHKPAQVVATAHVRVEVSGPVLGNEVVDVALDALGETRTSIFGYDIEPVTPQPASPGLQPGVYRVNVYRD